MNPPTNTVSNMLLIMLLTFLSGLGSSILTFLAYGHPAMWLGVFILAVVFSAIAGYAYLMVTL